MVLNKKGESGIMWLIAIALAVLVLQQVGVFDFRTLGQGSTVGEDGTTTTPSTGTDIANFCPDPSNTMTYGPMQRKYNPTTSMSAENARSWIAGIDQGTNADSSTRTVGAGQEIAIIYGYQSATHYSDAAVFKAPCAPFSSASQDGSAHLLWQHATNITVTTTNGDNGNVNDGIGSSNESIGSGELGKFTLKLEGTNLQAFSPARNAWAPAEVTPTYFPTQSRPEKSRIVMVAVFNGSRYDSSQITISGGEMVKDNTYYPAGIHSVANVDDDTVTFVTEGCPRAGQKICNLNLGTLSVQAKTGENPPGGYDTGAAAVGGGDIRLDFYNQDWDTHTEASTMVFGTEQDDGTIAGFALQRAHLDVN